MIKSKCTIKAAIQKLDFKKDICKNNNTFKKMDTNLISKIINMETKDISLTVHCML